MGYTTVIGGLLKILVSLTFLIQFFYSPYQSFTQDKRQTLTSSDKAFSNLSIIYEPVRVIQFQPWELVTALAWSPDQEWIVVASGNKLLSYDTGTWEPRWEYSMPALTSSLAISQDGRWLASGSRDGMVRIWSTPGDLAGQVNPGPDLVIEAHKKGVNCVAFAPGGNYLASGGNDSIARFWDLQTGENLGQMIGGTYAVPSIAFSPDGTILAVVNGIDVRLREVGSERIVGTIQSDHPLFSLAYHPTQNIFVTGSIDNQLAKWDAAQAFRTGQESYPDPVTFLGHHGKPGTFRSLVWQVSFNTQGDLLATAGGDALVSIWNVENQELVAELSGHRLAVSCVAFAPDDHFLASGSLDASLRIWKVVGP